MAISPVAGFKQSPELRSRTQQILQRTAEQRPNMPPELRDDQTQMSDELVGEVGKTLQSQGDVPEGNLDAMIAAVAQNFMDRKIEQPGAAEGAGDSKAQKQKKAEWDPAVKAGSVIPPQGRIGEITIKEEDKKPTDKKPDKAGKPGQPGQAPAAGKGVATGGAGAKVGSAQPGAQTQKNAKAPSGQDQRQDGETVEFSPESQQMAQKMQAQGMKTPGLNPNDKSQGGKGDQKMDVLMPSAGVTQAVKVREAGPIEDGGVLMSYRKLDDLPSGSVAILKDKKGPEAVEEYRERLQRGEKLPQLSEEQMRQLKSPVATH